MPFYNQSKDPTVDGDAVALAYFNEMQQIPGFQVMPIGVTRRMMEGINFQPRSDEDFQKLAAMLGVDVVLVGSVTDFSPYYPPRMGVKVNWYAANPCFHPIPAGYGLPWGTSEEEFIPASLVQAAEFELAKEQLKTQTPDPPPIPLVPPPEEEPAALPEGAFASAEMELTSAKGEVSVLAAGPIHSAGPHAGESIPGDLPHNWPDPRGFVPPPPSPVVPVCNPHTGPIITHTRMYNGDDSQFTEALANYFYFQDDARFGGWQGYLQRSDDFIRFCCHLHVTETLAARGGTGKTRVVRRWPIGRYER